MFDAEFELEAELEDLMVALSRSNPAAQAEYETPQVRTIRDQSGITGQIARGTLDENRLTDAVFYDRHPEWKGKSLRYARPSLRQEWIQIRNAIVRPVLQRPRAIPQPVPAPLPKPAVPPGVKISLDSATLTISVTTDQTNTQRLLQHKTLTRR
jgi:hypothetical protein